MKPSSNTLVVCLLFAGAACTVPNQSPIQILAAVPLTPGPAAGGICQPLAGVVQAGGSLDIGSVAAYIIQFNVTSNLETTTTVVGGETIADSSRNTFFAKQLLYSYSSTPALSTPDELIPYYYVIPPGGGTGGAIRPNLITYNLAQKLLDNVRVGDTLSLLVTLQLQGSLMSGQKINSNKVTYSILIYRSNFAGCARGDIQVPSGPCGFPGGQDGALVACCRGLNPVPNGCPTGP